VKAIKMLKENNKARDQASRGNTLLLFGLPLSKDELDWTKTTAPVVLNPSSLLPKLKVLFPPFPVVYTRVVMLQSEKARPWIIEYASPPRFIDKFNKFINIHHHHPSSAANHQKFVE
jgi:hypothetical protein